MRESFFEHSNCGKLLQIIATVKVSRILIAQTVEICCNLMAKLPVSRNLIAQTVQTYSKLIQNPLVSRNLTA